MASQIEAARTSLPIDHNGKNGGSLVFETERRLGLATGTRHGTNRQI
jgi:hypothetical protein